MNDESKTARAVILAPERELRMPDGTPLGMGILGAAKFGAIRRVLESAARAATAKANFHTAEAAVAHALVARERARNQLRNIDAICDDDSARFAEGAEIARLRRRLEKMELEDQIAEREARRSKIRGAAIDREHPHSGGVAQDEFAAFMKDLQRLPDVAKAVATAKEQIIKNAGGDEHMLEADRQSCEILDAMLHSFMSKKAGDAAL